jgi:hypothetical protein
MPPRAHGDDDEDYATMPPRAHGDDYDDYNEFGEDDCSPVVKMPTVRSWRLLRAIVCDSDSPISPACIHG